jgi:hypothetical protein
MEVYKEGKILAFFFKSLGGMADQLIQTKSNSLLWELFENKKNKLEKLYISRPKLSKTEVDLLVSVSHFPTLTSASSILKSTEILSKLLRDRLCAIVETLHATQDRERQFKMIHLIYRCYEHIVLMGSLDKVDPQFLKEQKLFFLPCLVCGLVGRKMCSGCLRACYCSVECQAVDWRGHKKVCCFSTP